jgi:hypothetical protein
MYEGRTGLSKWRYYVFRLVVGWERLLLGPPPPDHPISWPTRGGLDPTSQYLGYRSLSLSGFLSLFLSLALALPPRLFRYTQERERERMYHTAAAETPHSFPIPFSRQMHLGGYRPGWGAAEI